MSLLRQSTAMPAFPPPRGLDARLAPRLAKLAAAARWSSRCRVPLLVVASLIFLAGTYRAFSTLAISPAELRGAPLLILAALIFPSLVYGGIGLSLLARSADLSMPVGKATLISAYAYLAEMLPLPGGAVIRTGALMQAGSTLGRSSALVLLTAILWVSLATLGAGFTLWPISAHVAAPLLVIGGLTSAAIFIWLWSIGGAVVALSTLAHRIAGILLTALRLTLAFAALHMPMSFSQTFPFVLAILLGSASSIAPAGLGVSESLAALAATATDHPAGIAFLAVGIDRIFCLGGCALLTLSAQLGNAFRSAVSRAADSSESGSD